MSASAAGSVRWSAATFAYPDGPAALGPIALDASAGEILLVVGSSGSGKSTLLRTVNGLVPHSSGGRFSGDVVSGGRSITTHRPRDLADVVGFVHQTPEAQFVVDDVEHDIAFVLENLGTDSATMRRRVEEVLDALGVAHLRHRSPATLSGGERQRCAIAGALASAPPILVLDEPTSMLDPQGADDVLAAVRRLNDDLGTTVILAEHRLERAAAMADRAVVLAAGQVVEDGSPATVIANLPGAPPVTHLGRLLGWAPPPLTVRDARAAARHNGDADRLAEADQTSSGTSTETNSPMTRAPGHREPHGEHRATAPLVGPGASGAATATPVAPGASGSVSAMPVEPSANRTPAAPPVRPGVNDAAVATPSGPGAAGAASTTPVSPSATGRLIGGRRRRRDGPVAASAGAPMVRLRSVDVGHGAVTVVRDVDLDVAEGEIIALLGRNGSGKTTLLRALAGIAKVPNGTVEATVPVAYVPQEPDSLLFAETVRAELEATQRLLGRRDPVAVDRWLDALDLATLADRHPRSLSVGQRQRVAIAAVAVGGAPVLVLDEPTRGIDAPSREALERVVLAHATGGGAVVLATHDVELAARVATRVVVLGDGEVVADGAAREVLAGSLFAPQVLRVLPPYLTVAEVAAVHATLTGPVR